MAIQITKFFLKFFKIFLTFRKTRKMGLFIGIGMLVGVLINNIILKMEGDKHNCNSKKEEGSKDNTGSDEGEHISSEHENQPES